MLLNFGIVETIESLPVHTQTFLPDPQLLQLTPREAATVFIFMSEIGIIDHATPAPEPAPWPPFDIEYTRAEEIYWHLIQGDAISSIPTEYERVIVAHFIQRDREDQSAGSPFRLKVPGYKFSPDEFWHVTPNEALIISVQLRTLERTGELRKLITRLTDGETSQEYCDALEEHTEIMLQWITFNELAVRHGGYVIA